MSQILRRRGKEQFYDARGWSLFRLAHHRVQKHALVFPQPPCEDTDELLDQLNEELSFVKLEKDAYQITQLCTKARELRREVTTQSQHNHSIGTSASVSTSASTSELIEIIRQLQKLDYEALAWRQGPEWSYATLRRADLSHGGANESVLASFPETVHIHPDIWTAYEWNYHHCSRIIMHKQILACLHRAAALSISDDVGGGESNSVASLLTPLEIESMTIIRGLATKIAATVPQMLGDIDHTGCVRGVDAPAPRCRAIGAYFLLWPIKILKGDLAEIIPQEQIEAARAVFERIREYTGMRSLLGEYSMI